MPCRLVTLLCSRGWPLTHRDSPASAFLLLGSPHPDNTILLTRQGFVILTWKSLFLPKRNTGSFQLIKFCLNKRWRDIPLERKGRGKKVNENVISSFCDRVSWTPHRPGTHGIRTTPDPPAFTLSAGVIGVHHT